MNLNDKARDLAYAIMATSEFTDLKQSKSNIDRNKDLKSNVDEFMKKQMEIYSASNSSGRIEVETSELSRKFQSLSKIPEVEAFLKSSKNYTDMLLKIYKVINDTIESGF